MEELLGKIIICNRLRVDTDGNGVVTLVALKGCPLKCKYCINKDLYKAKSVNASVELLYNTVVKDDIYFEVSGGGVCFGGHEPLLQAEYIKKFTELVYKCGNNWNIYVETSLNVDKEKLILLLPFIDFWIIDVKDMNNEIYKKYTGKDNGLVKDNLKILLDKVSNDKIKIRLPLIPEFNTINDREKSKQELIAMGFQNFDEFNYEIRANA